MSRAYKSQFETKGFVSPVNVISAQQAAVHRARMEDAEGRLGTIHYTNKIHTILRSPLELVTHPKLLDVIEEILGPDILLYNSTYIIKEAGSPSYVSWHQDLTYWGLDSDDLVSVWLALSGADEQSGCMRMIPGSHRDRRQKHDISKNDESNVLYQGQTVNGVDDGDAAYCPLRPGQASLHHGWTLHSSLPNQSNDRRIGLNAQYIAPHVRQTKLPGFSAMLVRGEDRHQHYANELTPEVDLDAPAMARLEEMNKLYREAHGHR